MKTRYYMLYYNRLKSDIYPYGWMEQIIDDFETTKGYQGIRVKRHWYPKCNLVDLTDGRRLRWDYNLEIPLWLSDPMLRAIANETGLMPDECKPCLTPAS